MRKQTSDENVGGRRSPPQDDCYAQHLLESYDRFFQTWSNFRQDMENQIDHNLKKQQKMYDDFFGQWNKLSGEMTSRLGKESLNETQREFYDVWRNYANKIGPRLARTMTDGLQGYGGISASLDRYSKKIGEDAQKLMDKTWDPQKLEHLYDAWLEFGMSVRKQMEGAMSQGRIEADQLSKTWFEMSNRMQHLISSVGEKSGDYSDLVNTWQKFSSEVGDTLIKAVNGTGQDLDKLKKTWSDYYVKVEKEMARLAEEIGLGYEELYARFFQQQGKALERMSEWWQIASDTARRELSTLERRLLDLEKRVKETSR